jgi:hypothetical protein
MSKRGFVVVEVADGSVDDTHVIGVESSVETIVLDWDSLDIDRDEAAVKLDELRAIPDAPACVSEAIDRLVGIIDDDDEEDLEEDESEDEDDIEDDIEDDDDEADLDDEDEQDAA